jgi:hypothetical protein
MSAVSSGREGFIGALAGDELVGVVGFRAAVAAENKGRIAVLGARGFDVRSGAEAARRRGRAGGCIRGGEPDLEVPHIFHTFPINAGLYIGEGTAAWFTDKTRTAAWVSAMTRTAAWISVVVRQTGTSVLAGRDEAGAPTQAEQLELLQLVAEGLPFKGGLFRTALGDVINRRRGFSRCRGWIRDGWLMLLLLLLLVLVGHVKSGGVWGADLLEREHEIVVRTFAAESDESREPRHTRRRRPANGGIARAALRCLKRGLRGGRLFLRR